MNLRRLQRGIFSPFGVNQSQNVAVLQQGDTDPYWSSVVLLAGNNNAANGTTTFTDQSTAARTITRGGSAVYSSAKAPSGMTTSIAFTRATSDFLSVALSADFGFSVGTVEAYMYCTDFSNNSVQWQWNNYSPALYVDTSGTVRVYNSGAFSLGTSITTGGWVHVAFDLSGTAITGYVGGVAGSSPYTYSATNSSVGTGYIGKDNGGALFNGFMCSLRVTKGVRRYTAAFTPPTLPLPTS